MIAIQISQDISRTRRDIRLSYIYYYTDASVLQESNQWRIFHILTSEDIDDVIYHILH